MVSTPHLTQDAPETAASVQPCSESEMAGSAKGAGQGQRKKAALPWHKVKWWWVVLMVNHPVAGRRWAWRKVTKQKKARLQLVSPAGVAWNFRLNYGAWIQRETTDGTKESSISEAVKGPGTGDQ